MKPSKKNIFPLLVRMIKSGQLNADGPISLFFQEKHKGWFSHPQQLVVTIRGDAVFVRCSRLPFARPLVYSLSELRSAEK